jgi:TctA family transporter
LPCSRRVGRHGAEVRRVRVLLAGRVRRHRLGTLTGDDPLKGWIAGFSASSSPPSGRTAIYAFDRFTFGNRDLAGGFALVPALVGAFGFAEI